MEPTQPQVTSEIIEQVIDAYKAYIRTLQKLKEFDAKEYEKVPEIIKRYTNDEIEKLNQYDAEALLEANAIPPTDFGPVEEGHLLIARSYFRMLQKLKGSAEFQKVPAVIRQLTDDEIENLDAAHLQALRLTGALPDKMLPHGTLEMQEIAKVNKALYDFCMQDPELRQYAEEPTTFSDPKKAQAFRNNPKIRAFFQSHPEYQKILDDFTARQTRATLERYGMAQPPLQKKGNQPYMTHPYGEPDENQPQNVAATGINKLIQQIQQMNHG